LSRFRILALFATLAALATALAACGGGSSSDDPQAVVENATLEGVRSGELDLSLRVESSGAEGGNLELSLAGLFQGQGGENLPQLDLDVQATGKVKGESIDFDGGVVLLTDRAYVNYEGTEYEVDPTTFGFIKSSLEQAQKQGSEGDAGNPTACQKAVSGLKVSEFAKGLKDEGSADVDGTSTTKVSGELNAGKAIDALIDLTEDPACSAQLEAAGPLPLGELEKAKREVSTALKRSHVELYVGDDDIIRKVVAEFTVAPKGEGTVDVQLEFSLGGVNEDQQIGAPSGAVKPLEALFLKLGINPLELLEEATSGGGLGGLLEKLDSQSSDGGGGSTGGGSGGSEPSSGESSDQSAYLQCLQNAETPVDLQNCASLSG
jgi:hypothetical protein